MHTELVTAQKELKSAKETLNARKKRANLCFLLKKFSISHADLICGGDFAIRKQMAWWLSYEDEIASNSEPNVNFKVGVYL